MKTFVTAFRTFALMTFITGLAYPLLVTVIAQVTMPWRANGSLLEKEGRVIGSALIAQKTTDERYFWPRPSANNYDPLKSGGSNLGPTSLKLKNEVIKRQDQVGKNAPPELLYASGSGLDPHISFEAALYQIPRIAKSRSISTQHLEQLVEAHVEGKKLWLFGKGYINVYLLNQALDAKR